MKILRQMAALICIFAAMSTGLSAAQELQMQAHTSFVYGRSELGRELICHRIGTPQAAKSILLVFGVHGFEDAFDHDGEVLKLIAEKVIAHYEENPQTLQNFCLYIVPSANPDGLIEGTTKDGFGRCNANGMDINRDFPIGWTKRKEARNKTGKEAFSTAEARAIRDLAESVQPTYGVDVHGWIEASYGTGKMAKIFAKPFNFTFKKPPSGGMLCRWLDSITREGIMI